MEAKTKNILGISILLGGLVVSYVYMVKGNPFKRKSNESNTTPRDIDMTPYEGRTEYESMFGNESVRGFPMPNNIDGLNFQNNKISVISKPDISDLFDGKIRPMSQFSLINAGNSDLGYRFRDGYVYLMKYEDLKDKIILTKKTYIK